MRSIAGLAKQGVEMNILKNTAKGSCNNLRQVFAGTIRKLIASVMSALMLTLSGTTHAQEPAAMMVRISEIEIVASQLDQYKAILAEEAQASVKLEPGVIAIFPTYEKESDTTFRILEIYADRRAYESHLKTPHFQKYKATTLQMVKSLKLIDMQAIDAGTMARMFKKIQASTR
jgi:quinol monooxygenase YgiN